MNIDEFWKLIDEAREASNHDISMQASLLAEMLSRRSVNEILDYETIMYDLLDHAYDAALWDAAFIIGCGCGDSGFKDFRAWLIAQGKEVYENALADPESLVDRIDVNENAQEGALLYVVMTAYEQKTGHEIPPETFRHREAPILKGTHWSEETVQERFPILAAKFGDCERRWPLIY